MSEERIFVNGSWYVKELQSTEEIDIGKNIVEFIGCVYETDDYCWEATKISKDNEMLYDGVDVKFTDKTKKPWRDEHWDNVSWLIGVHDFNEDSLKTAQEIMNPEGIRHFQAFIGKLIEKQWL